MLTALPFPRRINLELTNYCNQRCVLCPRQEFTRGLGFMQRDLFERVVLECAGRDTTLWLHFLGEPLLHPELVDMIASARAAGVRQIGLSTNGVSLAGARAEALLDAGLDRLECSMDALDREGYRALRGRDHFERVMQNVRAFLALKQRRGLEKPVVSIQFMRTPEVDERIEEIVDTWRGALGPRDFVMTIRPAGFGGAIDAGPQEEGGAATRPPCLWLFESLLVLQDGTVTMCGADWDAAAPLGHLRDASIEEIWTGLEAKRRREAHLAGRFGDVGPCGPCQDWRLADGSGYANALEEVARRRARSGERRALG